MNDMERYKNGNISEDWSGPTELELIHKAELTDLEEEISQLSLINNQLLMNLINTIDILKIHEKNEPLLEEEKVILSKTKNIIIQAENAIALIKK